MGKIKAFYVPFQGGKSLAFGDPKEGCRLKGPILYVPKKGAVFYQSSVQGDADGMGIVTVDADSFEGGVGREMYLEQLGKQIMGDPSVSEEYKGEKFDLSQGVREVEISEEDFKDIAMDAKTAYTHLNRFRRDAFKLIFKLERNL